MSDIALVEVTFADLAEGERIGAVVLDERLAACVNLMPCQSLYRWNGKVERGAEVIGHFKTTGMRARRLAERIAALHSYDLPAIVVRTANAAPALVKWVEDAVD